MQIILHHAQRYIAAMPPAIAGSGGHHATFAVAVALVRGYALNEADAYTLLADWNQAHASPPWSESELRHKLRSAATSATAPLGYLLDRTRSLDAVRTTPDFESAAEKKALQRRAWPEFKPLKPAGVRAVAQLRRLPLAAVDLAHKCGLIGGAEIEGHSAFILREGTFAQARRLDGQPFTRHDGTAIKAKNLAGAQGAFIGQQYLGKEPPVLLVEGCIGWLEAVAAIVITDHTEWAVLAAVSAQSRLTRDPLLLQQLAGRRVRIVPDNDPKGQGRDAAAVWTAELRSVGAHVDAYALPHEAKDMGDLIAASDHYADTLNEIFTL